jgi:peptidoglycan/xylan/chitin deacetylase (PgdA/CDA1 family)
MQIARGWRPLLKHTAASAIWRAHQHPLTAGVMPGRKTPLILGYHRVVENFEAASRTQMPTMLIDRAMFERHLDLIGRHFRFVGLDEIAERITRGVAFDEPVAAVTFDDGYRDVYEHAYPVLRRKGIPAAMFVVTGRVGRVSWLTHDKLYHLLEKVYRTWNDPLLAIDRLLDGTGVPALPRLRQRDATATPYALVSSLLPELSQAEANRVVQHLCASLGNGVHHAPENVTWPMVLEMRRAGFVIGSHTVNHAWLGREVQTLRRSELRDSKAELELQLDEPVEHFAYPGGQFTPAVVEDVAEAGYRFAYTACAHRDARYPSLTLDRLLLWQGSSLAADRTFSPDVLRCQAHDLWPAVRRCGRGHQ